MASSIPAGFSILPLSIAQLSLAAVLKCGQSFRWTALPLASSNATTLDVEYRLALRDRVICLRQSSDTLFYRAVYPDASSKAHDAETLAWLKDYFQLDVDLVELYDKWAEMDPVFRSFRARFSGIRMLRQDPWENLVSFICSQNNHISRITNMVQSLCTHFSPTVISLPHPLSPSESCPYHAFPSPAALASPDTSSILRSLGFGYRAEYLQRTAQMLVDEHGERGAEDFIMRLRQHTAEDAREKLLKFVGVGRKVADCVLLMSLDKRGVVPVDTHVHQIAVKHYGMRGAGNKVSMTPKLYNEVQSKLAGVWGEYAGWAHSVLFTADLKSFSSFGLPTPSPSVSPNVTPAKTPKGKSKAVVSFTDSPVLSAPVTKRKRVASEAKAEISETFILEREEGGLADRVKRRRRTAIRSYADPISA